MSPEQPAWLTQVNVRAAKIARIARGGERPLVIAVMGRTAVGKTTLGRALGSLPGFSYLSQSACKVRLKPAFAPENNLDEELRDEGYRLAIAQALAEVAIGRVPVVDASWHRRRRREWLYHACRGAGTDLVLIYLCCPALAEIRRRLALRAVRKAGVDDLADAWQVHLHIDRKFDEPDEAVAQHPECNVAFTTLNNP